MEAVPSHHGCQGPGPYASAAMGKHTWWRDGVLYQIYPRSFADSNRDGIGDLQGVRSRLDHLEWLGGDGIWLHPTMPSPHHDWGFDVADYCAGHPGLGTPGGPAEPGGGAGGRGVPPPLAPGPHPT